MSAYYNEFDPKAAAWLRQLIKDGLIADGYVDERSISAVTSSDIKGFTQHHFFAGIGGWSHALRVAGWNDDRPVCTASLPCQPFSVAGNQKGIDDERHLLPHFIELVRQCEFDTIFGEQVPGAIKHGWLDDLYDEMERENYAIGATVLTAAGAGKAHVRQRLYWAAKSRLSNTQDRDWRREPQRAPGISRKARNEFGGNGEYSGVADTINTRPEGRLSGGEGSQRKNINGYARCNSADSRGDDSIEWLYCRDEKHRPIESSIKPLVDGATKGMVQSGNTIDYDNTGIARAMRLKGYGNAICVPTATLFINAYMSVTDEIYRD